jgi:undecaprenyl-diphosphatase
MDIFQATILGIIQGFTEFLPVSSSAHLILVPYFMKWKDQGLAFDVALHMGTLVAILAFFWRDWVALIKQVFGKTDEHLTTNWKYIVAATVPGAIIGFLLEKHVEENFRSPALIAVTMAVFGIGLWVFDQKGKKEKEISTVSIKDALCVGAAQSLAVIPGVSRSGVTITAALALGLTRPAAARFSFLLSAPIIAGAGILKSKHIFHALVAGGPEATAVAVGFVASLLSGLIAVGLLSALIRSRTYALFSVYRVILAFVIVIAVFR